MGNPFDDFTSVERRNIFIYIVGIMLYKFGLEAFSGSITLLATDRFNQQNTFTNLAILQGLNQAFQCVGSIAIAPLIKRFPTKNVLSASVFIFGLLSAIIIIIDVSTGGKIPLDGKQRYGAWNSLILFPIYSIIGICHGMVELIRRVIPRDIVGGDVVKLKKMDATVHAFYEVAGTAGAFFSAFLVLRLGNALAPSMTPFLFVFSAIAWTFIGLLDADLENRKRLESLEDRSLLTQIGHGFSHFGLSVYRGVQIIFSSRKFIWLIPGYSIPLFTHRYLESQLTPAFAKRILNQGAYAQIMVGGSNFGELLGAIFVLFFARKIRTPIPWLRLDALCLLIIWILPFSYPAPEDALSYAWTLAAIWIPVSFGWAAGDVSLAAYIQASLAKMEKPDDKVSPLGAVMAFLYSFYIILYAVLGPVLGKVIDNSSKANDGDIRPALIYVGGVMYTVVSVVLMASTFIPKGSFAFNPSLIDDTAIEDEENLVENYHDDFKEPVKIAVIGGSGLYNLEGLEFVAEVSPETPWGKPSDAIIIAKNQAGLHVAFLARHGRGHYLTPTEVPSRANIAALKSLGVEAIIAFSAVGSLREELKPRDFILPSQVIDRTKGIRPSTFFEDGLVAHAMFADPFSAVLEEVIWAQRAVVEDADFHRQKTLICMEGPQFSTRAESNMYRSFGADLINMSVLPEAKLAREAEIAYQMICMSTDYDCWKEHEVAVTVEAVVANLKANTGNAQRLLSAILPGVQEVVESGKATEGLDGSMRFACMTAPEKRSKSAVQKLEFLLPGYYTICN
ncbi:hypothetical protein BG011_007608 [Mortierella polycephala]|uniref:S-methyl-5'-thioadenosine phosphorylase n=1 Tax=Mortierella polycephala TaxID=41804 RepID=A0A9P6PSX8_9FUNG|nr:hypothetical protein BG011_007608 [Mortierella polycephala]